MEQAAEWVTPAQAAEILGISIRTVQHLCAKTPPDLICEKWGRSWKVSMESIRKFKPRSEGGQPKKS